MSSTDSLEELVVQAKEARSKAYAPYSRFRVGAALRATSGKIYTGCNIENASYGLSMCAERVAVFKAVCAGDSQLEELAVVSETMAAPCGACRQVLAEFGLGATVIIADLGEGRRITTVGDLVPLAFTPSSLPRGESEAG